MDFASLIKSELDNKYISMLSGETAQPFTTEEIKTVKKVVSSYETLCKRLETEREDAILAEERREVQEQKAAAERRRAADAERAKKEHRESIIQVLAFSWPLLITIISAIIIFSHKTQISIESSYGGVVTGWVFFMLASIIAPAILLKVKSKHRASDSFSRISAISIAIVAFILTIVMIATSAKLSSHYDPTSFVRIEVINKTQSTSYSSYTSKISFTLSNTSNIEVSSIKGDMILYNGTTSIGTYDASFNGGCPAGSSRNVGFDITEYSGDLSLYNTSFSNLGVSFKVTSMTFNGNYKEYNFDGKTVTLKEASSS